MQWLEKHYRGILAVVVVCLILGGFLWYRAHKEFVPYASFNDFLDERPRTLSEIESYTENLKEAYEKDTYGGQTPQETFDLFVKALKAGDTKLASKYFLIEKQKEMEEQFEAGKESGYIKSLIQDLERVDSRVSIGESSFRFTSVDNESAAKFTFDLVNNPYTNVWKFEDL